MGQLLVRNLPDETIAAIKARAARNNRSVEAEHRAILSEATISEVEPPWGPNRKAEWFEQARLLREELAGRTFTPSEDIIRELRDEP